MKDVFSGGNGAAFPRKPGSSGPTAGSANKTGHKNGSAFPRKPDGKAPKK